MSDFDQKVLTFLYQPIICARAFSLFLTLWTELSPTQIRSERKSHLELLDLLNCDLPNFYLSRQKLEGIGLLKSYEGQDNLGRYFVYQLIRPVSPNVFFKDDLLSSLLLEAIGENRFKELAKQFKLPQIDTKNLKDVSTDFLTAFHISDSTIKEPDSLIRETQAEFKQASSQEDAQPISLSTDHFDFKLLKDLLSHSFTDWNSVDQAQRLILSEHLLYGIDEVEMSRQIGQATDLVTNQLKPKKLQQQISKSFTSQTAHKESYATSPASTEPKSVPEKKTSEEKLTEEDKQLIKAAKAYAPATYLENLKMAIHGGYVTYGERQILKDLIDRNLFPVSVINILISYIVIDQGATTLPSKLVDTMVNSWSRAHVATPEDAILQIKKFANEKTTARKAKTTSRKVVEKETLPDWAKSDAPAVKPTTVKKSDQELLNRRLKELRKQNKEED